MSDDLGMNMWAEGNISMEALSQKEQHTCLRKSKNAVRLK